MADEPITKEEYTAYDKSLPKGEVKRVYQVLYDYQQSDKRRKWEKKRDLCWAAVGDNEMWTDAEKSQLKKKHQVDLVIDRMGKGVQGSAAIVTDSKPEVRFHPIGSGDLYVADILKRAHDFCWEKNGGQDHVYNLVEECKIGGIDFFHVRYNRNTSPFGRLEFRAIKDPTIVYWDEHAEAIDLSDSHLIIAQRRSREYIKNHYEEIKDEDLRFDPLPDTDNDEPGGESHTITGADNYAVSPEKSLETAPINKKEIWEIEAWMIHVVHEDWVVMFLAGGTEPEVTPLPELPKGMTKEQFLNDLTAREDVLVAEIIKRTIHKRKQCIIVGKKLVYSEVNPYGEDSDGNPILGLIPVIHNRTKTSYPTCPSFKALDINREKNKRRAQFIYAASMEIASPVVRTQDSKWEGEPGTPGSELIVSKGAAFMPQRMAGGGVNLAGFIQLEAQADADIDDQYDLQDVMRGKIPPGNERTSGKMVLALQDMGGTMSKPFLRKVEGGLVRLAKANMAIILQFWHRGMWERLLEPEEMMTKVPQDMVEPEGLANDTAAQYANRNKWLEALEKIRPMDPTKESGLSLLDFDVKMTAGSSLPTNRIAKYSLAVELATAGIYDQQAVLEYVDDPNKERILERMKQQQTMLLQQEAGKKK